MYDHVTATVYSVGALCSAGISPLHRPQKHIGWCRILEFKDFTVANAVLW